MPLARRASLDSSKVNFCTAAEKEICLVGVAPARRPIFVAEEKGVQTMYVRAGNSMRPSNTPDAVAYATEHCGSLWFGWAQSSLARGFDVRAKHRSSPATYARPDADLKG
jgi:hypothetical protein